jgi:hypothetical protein
MKTSPVKSSKTDASKKRSRGEAENADLSSSPPSTPRPNPAKEWKKAKLKTKDLLALVNSGFLLVSMSVMSNFIFFKVLEKRTLSPLPPSMSTLLSLEPATTGFRMSGKRPGSEKHVHWSAREKVLGTCKRNQSPKWVLVMLTTQLKN